MQANTKLPIDNHDGKTKKMNKSRSSKMFDQEGSLRFLPNGHELSRQPGKPPPYLSTTKQPTHKMPSPNYMKSTKSSQAKKDQVKVRSLKLQRVAKCLSRSSSLQKMRTLTKIPSFKHTRKTVGKGNKWSKGVLCDEKKTCSSTQKDSKFPIYLELNPGATEAQGTSTSKVCRYNHCSLNGLHHKPATPLKRFLASRRRVLDTQRVVKPQVISCKTKGSQKNKEKDSFFIEIYVSKRDVDSDDAKSLDLNFRPQISQNEDRKPKQEVKKSTCVGLEEFFGERYDLVLEEGKICDVHCDNESKMSSKTGIGDDQGVPDSKTDNNVGRHSEDYVTEKLLPYYHEEITVWQHFSDASSIADSDSTQQDEEKVEEPYMVKEDYTNYLPEHDATVHYKNQEFNSINQQGGVFFNTMLETTEAGSIDPDSCQDEDQTHNYNANEDKYTGAEVRIKKNAETIIDKSELIEDAPTKIKDVQHISVMTENPQDVNRNIDETDSGINADESVNLSAECEQAEDGNSLADDANDKHGEKEGSKFIIPTLRNSEEQDVSNIVKLRSNENRATVNEPEMEESDNEEELYAVSDMENETSPKTKENFSDKVTEPDQDLINNCNKSKSWTRCKKSESEIEEVRKFNPRGPNFLPIQPDPEAEKINLRHQDTDERRNSEEWMLDYALQKTVNQLASARKKKVALLVEAFESVIPIPEWETPQETNSSDYSHPKPIHACS